MKTKRILLYVAYSIGMFLAALSVTMMMLMLFDPEVEAVLKKFLVYGAALGFGWVVLLLAAMFKPFERRFVLLVTLLALIVTILTSLMVQKQETLQMWYFWFSMIVPGIVALFYLFVYFFSRPGSENGEPDLTEKPGVDDAY